VPLLPVFQALPLSLNGVMRILELMDWGDADEFISQGSIGGDVPREDDDYFIIIAPQNIVGYSVLPYLQEMEKAVGDRPMIMINPKLGDIQSAQNVMSIRGRGERREYVSAWEEAGGRGRCTLTPPDPYLKGAWYPGGFNP
jgi:adenylate kinase